MNSGVSIAASPSRMMFVLRLRAIRSEPRTLRTAAVSMVDNVLVVLLDDVGYGAASAFGGPAATPTQYACRPTV